MRRLIHSAGGFITAFIITSVIIAAIAAVSVLGDDGKALYFEKDTGTFYFFGEEYIANESFITASKSLFDFNRVFLGDRLQSFVGQTISFCTGYVFDAFSIMFGLFEGMINNSV